MPITVQTKNLSDAELHAVTLFLIESIVDKEGPLTPEDTQRIWDLLQECNSANLRTIQESWRCKQLLGLE